MQGPIIFDFRNDAETVVNAAAGTVTGSWDTVEVVAQDMTAPDIAALLAGDTYFNVHTNRDTTGFIRGQILRNGTEGDLIDLTALNIGSFARSRQSLAEAAGDAVITTFFNGVASTVTLDEVARARRSCPLTLCSQGMPHKPSLALPIGMTSLEPAGTTP